jgi:hypothetical protein
MVELEETVVVYVCVIVSSITAHHDVQTGRPTNLQIFFSLFFRKRRLQLRFRLLIKEGGDDIDLM